MINFSNAKISEKYIIKKIEKAVFGYFGQSNFFKVDIIIVDEKTIQKANLEQRNIDSVTDVLSFPNFEKLELNKNKDDFESFEFDGKYVYLGSILICRQRAIDQAKEYGHSFNRELGFLACHGFLHLLGFDHIEKKDEIEMFKHQKNIMKKVGLKRK